MLHDFYKTGTGRYMFVHSRIFTRLQLQRAFLHTERLLQDWDWKGYFLSIARLLQDWDWKEHFCPQQDFYKTRTGNGIFAHSRIFTKTRKGIFVHSKMFYKTGTGKGIFTTARFLQDWVWNGPFFTQQDFYKAGTGKTFLPTAGYLQNWEFISIKKTQALLSVTEYCIMP